MSAAHSEARRQQILDAARVCFIRNGFHQTSMHDVVAEADLSVGAAYRYFPSKTELIVALAQQMTDQIQSAFDAVARQRPRPSLTVAVQRAVDLANEHSGPDGVLRLAVQVWGEAQRDPVLASFVDGFFRTIRTTLVTLARSAQDAGELPADADPEGVGAVLFAIIPGYALQRMMTGGPEPEVFKDGLRALIGP